MDERARQGLPVAFHGESVKRHLDDFDLEASLNEVSYLSSPSTSILTMRYRSLSAVARCWSSHGNTVCALMAIREQD